MNTFNANIELKRIGLTLNQIEELNLPPFYAKEKDGNYKEYVKNTGTTLAWELDALPPEKLSEIFERNIAELTDYDALQKMIELEKGDKTYFSEIIDKRIHQ